MPIQMNLKGRVPVHIWSSTVEEKALLQLQNISKLPFVFKHVAAMPDVHLGIGATVGSVIATQGALCPAAVGVDIGCGMMAVKTDLRLEQIESKLPEIRRSIERSVPVGHNSNTSVSKTVESSLDWAELSKIEMADKDLIKRARLQMGSLGGGNHFIEICLDGDQNVWVLLHSGSRNLGKTLAERFINEAKGLMKEKLIKLPDPDLAYLTEESKEFKDYWQALQFCQSYAYQNRREMMMRVLKDISYNVYRETNRIQKLMEVNCHHNYSVRETHFGENVLVTRKGAVRAGKGELGIIPGSMGARSFIVKGLGNEMSFESCSHGAGRRMSRTEAKKKFTVRDLARETAGVECRKDKGVLDEIPSAYKDIEQVMRDQSDLVEVVAQLKQILCVKG